MKRSAFLLIILICIPAIAQAPGDVCAIYCYQNKEMNTTPIQTLSGLPCFPDFGFSVPNGAYGFYDYTGTGTLRMYKPTNYGALAFSVSKH